jgi:NodT family efflux transporter outer membrane factor (OMF) lipoprotein
VSRHNNISNRLVALCGFIIVSACSVGPDFTPPQPPVAASYDSAPLPDKTAASEGPMGVAQQFVPAKDIPSAWWALFHSQALDALIDQAIKNNPDMAAAEASLRVTQENIAAGQATFFPAVNGGFNSTRQKISGAEYGGGFPSSTYNLYNASVNVSYGIDVFGSLRRQVEELEAQQDYQRFQLEATYLSLTANVVTAAIQEASLRGQIDATHEILNEEDKQNNVLQKQFEFGAINKAGLLAQQATIAQTRATLPPLEKQLSVIRHELSVLVGDLPSVAPNAQFNLATFTLPQELPVGVPSRLVEQRPDVKAAEANLHIASAAIGVAEAARLPQFTINADVASVATNIGKLFIPGSGIWSIGGDLAQTLFDAGRLGHEQKAAEAEYDVAAAQYRKTVLSAFQDVANVLQALQSDADALKANMAAEQSAADSLKLSKDQYSSGAVSYLSLLTAEQTEQQTHIALVQAQAQRFADTAALFQALGGGWWNRTEDLPNTKNPDDAVSVVTNFLVP